MRPRTIRSVAHIVRQRSHTAGMRMKQFERLAIISISPTHIWRMVILICTVRLSNQCDRHCLLAINAALALHLLHALWTMDMPGCLEFGVCGTLCYAENLMRINIRIFGQLMLWRGKNAFNVRWFDLGILLAARVKCTHTHRAEPHKNT